MCTGHSSHQWLNKALKPESMAFRSKTDQQERPRVPCARSAPVSRHQAVQEQTKTLSLQEKERPLVSMEKRHANSSESDGTSSLHVHRSVDKEASITANCQVSGVSGGIWANIANSDCRTHSTKRIHRLWTPTFTRTHAQT